MLSVSLAGPWCLRLSGAALIPACFQSLNFSLLWILWVPSKLLNGFAWDSLSWFLLCQKPQTTQTETEIWKGISFHFPSSEHFFSPSPWGASFFLGLNTWVRGQSHHCHAHTQPLLHLQARSEKDKQMKPVSIYTCNKLSSGFHLFWKKMTVSNIWNIKGWILKVVRENLPADVFSMTFISKLLKFIILSKRPLLL